MKLPSSRPVEFGALSKEQFDYEIRKGYESIVNGDVLVFYFTDAETRK